MFANLFVNKYVSKTHRPTPEMMIAPVLGALCGITFTLSLYFMDEIHLYFLEMEQQEQRFAQQMGHTLSGWIEAHPKVALLSTAKNHINQSVEQFYEREMRFGTRIQPMASVAASKTEQPPSQESSDLTEEEPNILSIEVPPPPKPPQTVLMLGGSSMKTAMGSLLQSKFREQNLTPIREAQIGTGLARADVVDWLARTETLLQNHPEIDLVLLQFIGNDCQTMVDSNHQILAKYGTPEWKEAYLNRWKDLIGLIQSRNAEIVILGLPVMENKRFDGKLVEVTGWVQQLASEYAIPFIPLRALTSDANGSYKQYIQENGRNVRIRLEDGVHLSYQGSRMVSDFIMESLNSKFHWDNHRPE